MKIFRKISFLKCLIFPLSLTISGYISRQLLFHDGFFFILEKISTITKNHNQIKTQQQQSYKIIYLKIQKQMLRKKQKQKQRKNKTKNKQTNKQKNKLLTYVFKTVAILTIEPTVKSNFKFNISQQIG